MFTKGRNRGRGKEKGGMEAGGCEIELRRGFGVPQISTVSLA
jgi:hypothetical protein